MDKKAIKVIIMDVDGTLLSSKRVITPKSKEALLKAQENGCKVVLASGRPTTGLLDVAKELELEKHHGLLVSYNGSCVVDAQTMEILFNEPLPVEDGKAVLEHMKKFKVKPMIDKDDYMYVNDVFDCMIDFNDGFNIIQYEARGGGYHLCEKEDLADFLDFEVNKILTAADPSYLQEHQKEMMEPFKDRLSCLLTAPFYFEFTAEGIDKAKALDSVLIPMGYEKNQMIAFGDGHNDASMVAYAGTGVAMANAVQDLKDIADFVTLSNEEDGIAYALEQFL